MIEVMDIRKCSAANQADRDRIMSAVRGSEEPSVTSSVSVVFGIVRYKGFPFTRDSSSKVMFTHKGCPIEAL